MLDESLPHNCTRVNYYPYFDPSVPEEFRDVVGFPYYQVSDLGRIRSRHKRFGGLLDGWKLMHPRPNRYGYQVTVLRREGKAYCNIPIHKLVLEAFIGPRPAGMDGCHDPNPDRADNRLSNLRWDTHHANMQDAIKHGRQVGGETCGNARHDDSTIQLIRFLREHHRTKLIHLAEMFGTDTGNISRILNRKAWAHVPDADATFAPSLAEWFASLGMDLPVAFGTGRRQPSLLDR